MPSDVSEAYVCTFLQRVTQIPLGITTCAVRRRFPLLQGDDSFARGAGKDHGSRLQDSVFAAPGGS